MSDSNICELLFADQILIELETCHFKSPSYDFHGQGSSHKHVLHFAYEDNTD